MVEYPYVVTLDALKQFITQIPHTGIPVKLTHDELERRSFTSKSHRMIVPVMKFLKFIDEKGAPTDKWTSYRDTNQSAMVMGAAVKESYAELFALYPNAQEKDTEALRNFFRTRTSAGAQVLDKTVGTFKILCELSDFKTPDHEPITPIGEPGINITPLNPSKVDSKVNEGTKMPTITVNIQLQLPSTENAEIYDKIFESLKKHLIS